MLSPAANSPDVMTRVLEAVGAGARTTRDLQRSTGLSQQTVRSYLKSAAWLGFVRDGSAAELSPLGMEYVYAGPRRSRVYAAAVWSVPLAADLLTACDGRLPELDRIKAILSQSEPDSASSTIARRASAMRSLIAPAVGRERVSTRDATERQLPLPLDVAATIEAPVRLSPRMAGDVDPDAYRFVLACLIDFGELTLSHVRALLDRVGGETTDVAAVLGLALSRGDATQVDDALVVSAGAIERRDHVTNAASVLLSDPGFRRSLEHQLSPDPLNPPSLTATETRRYAAWSRRLLGDEPNITLPEAIDRLLLGRTLSSVPVAGDPGSPHASGGGAFVDVWRTSGLTIAFPPDLAQLQGGIAVVNRLLKSGRQRDRVALPTVVRRTGVVHAGALHPGEALPASVPDGRSLRLRLLRNCPAIVLTTCLLLAHRRSPADIELRLIDAEWGVRHAGTTRSLFDVLAAFSQSRGWCVARRPQAGLSSGDLLRAMEALGMAMFVGKTAVLDEVLFRRMASDAEEAEACAWLEPIRAAMVDEGLA